MMGDKHRPTDSGIVWVICFSFHDRYSYSLDGPHLRGVMF